MPAEYQARKAELYEELTKESIADGAAAAAVAWRKAERREKKEAARLIELAWAGWRVREGFDLAGNMLSKPPAPSAPTTSAPNPPSYPTSPAAPGPPPKSKPTPTLPLPTPPSSLNPPPLGKASNPVRTILPRPSAGPPTTSSTQTSSSTSSSWVLVPEADKWIGPTILEDVDFKRLNATISVEHVDILSLRSEGSLTDNVVNYYGSLMQARADAAFGGEDPDEKQREVLVLDTYLFFRLCDPRYDYDGFKMGRWYKGIDIYSYKKVVIPVFIGGNHFAVIVYDMCEKSASYYDSLRRSGIKILKTINKFFQEDHLRRKNYHFDADQFNLTRPLCPLQPDS